MKALPLKRLGILAVALLLPLAAAAQPRERGPRGPEREPGPAAKRPVLDEKARDAVQNAVQTARQETAEIQKELEKVRDHFQKSLDAEEVDEDAVMKIADRIGELETQLRKVQLHVQLAARRELGPEQAQRLGQALAARRGEGRPAFAPDRERPALRQQEAFGAGQGMGRRARAAQQGWVCPYCGQTPMRMQMDRPGPMGMGPGGPGPMGMGAIGPGRRGQWGAGPRGPMGMGPGGPEGRPFGPPAWDQPPMAERPGFSGRNRGPEGPGPAETPALERDQERPGRGPGPQQGRMRPEGAPERPDRPGAGPRDPERPRGPRGPRAGGEPDKPGPSGPPQEGPGPRE